MFSVILDGWCTVFDNILNDCNLIVMEIIMIIQDRLVCHTERDQSKWCIVCCFYVVYTGVFQPLCREMKQKLSKHYIQFEDKTVYVCKKNKLPIHYLPSKDNNRLGEMWVITSFKNQIIKLTRRMQLLKVICEFLNFWTRASAFWFEINSNQFLGYEKIRKSFFGRSLLFVSNI